MIFQFAANPFDLLKWHRSCHRYGCSSWCEFVQHPTLDRNWETVKTQFAFTIWWSLRNKSITFFMQVTRQFKWYITQVIYRNSPRSFVTQVWCSVTNQLSCQWDRRAYILVLPQFVEPMSNIMCIYIDINPTMQWLLCRARAHTAIECPLLFASGLVIHIKSINIFIIPAKCLAINSWAVKKEKHCLNWLWYGISTAVSVSFIASHTTSHVLKVALSLLLYKRCVPQNLACAQDRSKASIAFLTWSRSDSSGWTWILQWMNGTTFAASGIVGLSTCTSLHIQHLHVDET